MADLFISYSKEDRAEALTYRSAFAAKGVSVWWDDNLLAGDKWEAEIERQLHEASCVVVLWTETSAKSAFVRSEVTAALEEGRLVPVALAPLSQLGLRSPFDQIQATDMSDWDGDPDSAHFERLHSRVRESIIVNRLRRRERSSSVEFEFFKTIRESDDPHLWTDYVRRFPQGDFVDIARRKLVQIETSPQGGEPGPKPPSDAKRPWAAFAFAGLSAVLAISWFGSEFGSDIVYRLSAPTSETSVVETDNVVDESGNSLMARKDDLRAIADKFRSDSFSDDEARIAIRATLALSTEEIADDQEMIRAVETILDSFLSAERFDFAKQLESEHADLFKQRAEFFVSFCLAYGIRILETPRGDLNDLWSVAERDVFKRNVAEYREYATLDVVRQRFPEYAPMFEPFILKLQGASDREVVTRMRRVENISGRDLSNFNNVMQAYATGAHTVNPNGTDARLVSARVLDLIGEYAEEHDLDEWQRIGILASLD